MYEWIFPLLALTIYQVTPKGCDKTVNWILAGLFVLNWSFQEAVFGASKIEWLHQYLYDGLWFDSLTLLMYSVGALMFHKVGGSIQRNLAILGGGLCLLYAYLGTTSLYGNGIQDADMYYDEVFIILYIAQLFVAGGGMMLALSNKWMSGEGYDLNARNCRNTARRSHADNGDS